MMRALILSLLLFASQHSATYTESHIIRGYFRVIWIEIKCDKPIFSAICDVHLTNDSTNKYHDEFLNKGERMTLDYATIGTRYGNETSTSFTVQPGGGATVSIWWEDLK